MNHRIRVPIPALLATLAGAPARRALIVLALLVGSPAVAAADEYLFRMKTPPVDVNLAYFGLVAGGSNIEVRISMTATPLAQDLGGVGMYLAFDPGGGSLSLTANGRTLDLPLNVQMETPGGAPTLFTYSGNDPDVDGHRFNFRVHLFPVLTPAFDDILAFNVVPVYVSSGRMVLTVDLYEQQVELTATLQSVERVEPTSACVDPSQQLDEIATAISLLAEGLSGVGPGVAALGPALATLTGDVATLQGSVDDLAAAVAGRASQVSVDGLATQIATRASQASVDGLGARLTTIDQRLTTIRDTQIEIDNKVTRILRRLRRAGIGDESGI